MSSSIPWIASGVSLAAAAWFYHSYRRAILDQIKIANFLMEILTSDRERALQKENFLSFIIKSSYSNPDSLAAHCNELVIDIAKQRASQTIRANTDIYWAMNKSPLVFFEGGDPQRPR